ncbi:MAG: hypothetical protein IJV41_00085 [Oscillospiraceae bacterium]|nr:hypothetical protein [Oscillospiraceae bacterium]
MKKRICLLLAVLLTLSLLTGCANDRTSLLGDLFSRLDGRDSALPICRFDDMPYERPDLTAMREKAGEIEALLDSGARFKKVTKALEELYGLYYSMQTMTTLANIRNCQDLTDAYYAAEYAWCSAATAEVSQIMEEVYLACGSSSLAERLAADFFWEGFLDEYGPDSESMFTDAYLELAAQESELLADYRALLAYPVIEIDGQEWLLSDYIYGAGDEDILRAYGAYYESYNPKLAALYIDLVGVRRQMAAELGYESYAAMMYDLGYGRDFSLAEGDAFITAVRRTLVPLSVELEAAGVRDGVWYSLVDEDDLRLILSAVADGIGGEAKKAWRFMDRYELCDLRVSANKPDMAFQTYLDDYEAPFLFLGAYGDTEDIKTVTHEFGHYVQSYSDYNAYRTMDLAECFSQAMQYLSLDAMRGTLAAEEIDNLRRLNLIDTLDTYVQQISFADFERQVYAQPELTVDYLNDLSLRLAKDYGYYDGVNDLYYALSWIDITHFFEQPFYVISYPASAGVALEIYERELKEDGAGLAAFWDLLDTSDPGLLTAVEEAGLSDPLTPTRIADIATFLREELILVSHEK